MPPDIESTIRNEQTILRTELQELKKCQIQYFLFSIGATGAVFGFNKDLLGSVQNSNFMYLAPLLIILPCWLTFFDKANTITRLIGYVRVFIEEELKKDNKINIGYENALALFRQREEELGRNNNKFFFKKILKAIKDLFKAFFINLTRHQYWKINWLTFFLLSSTCCLYPILKNGNFEFLDNSFITTVYFLFVIAIVFSTIYTLWILWELMFGKYSYEKVKKFWQKEIFDEVSKSSSTASLKARK